VGDEDSFSDPISGSGLHGPGLLSKAYREHLFVEADGRCLPPAEVGHIGKML